MYDGLLTLNKIYTFIVVPSFRGLFVAMASDTALDGIVELEFW